MLQFGHGGEAVEIMSAQDCGMAIRDGFNSATAVKPWRWGGCSRGRRTTKSLQFGHGGEAVEIEQAVVVVEEGTSLQFGHGGEAVEMMHAGDAMVSRLVGASIRPRR